MTIGGISVIRNEQDWVYYSLKSIQDYVDNFIVIENGSTDRTVPEILRAGITPLYRDGSVAELRNEAASLTGCDWTWWIDGDEVWCNEDAERVVKYIKMYDDNPDVSILDFSLIRFVGDRFHWDGETSYRMPRVYRNSDVRMYGKSFPHCCDALARCEDDLDIVKGPYTTEAKVDKPYIMGVDCTFHHYAECGSYLHRKAKWYNYIKSSCPDNSASWIMQKLDGVKWGVDSKKVPWHGAQPEVFV